MAASNTDRTAAEAELGRQVLDLRVGGTSMYAIATMLDITPKRAQRLLSEALVADQAEKERTGYYEELKRLDAFARRLLQEHRSRRK